ncbi:MAG: hypothetical protein R3F11_11130 [Verrucomicrobiales bacterium]
MPASRSALEKCMGGKARRIGRGSGHGEGIGSGRHGAAQVEARRVRAAVDHDAVARTRARRS